jgi:hypothetical protein
MGDCARKLAALLGAVPEPELLGEVENDEVPDAPSGPPDDRIAFVTHALLGEFVSRETGGTSSDTLAGFGAFWDGGGGVPWTVVPSPQYEEVGSSKADEGADTDAPAFLAFLETLDEGKSETVLREWTDRYRGRSPHVVLIAPGASPAEAVAFLVTEHGDVMCARLRAGAVLVVQRLRRSVLACIEYARTHYLGEFHGDFVAHITDPWEPSGPLASTADEYLALASYDESQGEIVADAVAVAGGACAYGCVLFLLAAHLGRGALEGEISMKRAAVGYLVEHCAACHHGDMASRDWLRVMEATAHVYRDCPHFKDGVGALQTAVANTLARQHSEMLAGRVASTYGHAVPRAVYPAITFDMGVEPFADVDGAARWVGDAARWHAATGVQRNVLECVFLEKARAVMCAEALPAASLGSVVSIAMFLGSCPDPAALGMVVRCARLAVRAVGHKREGNFALKGMFGASSLPWVVAEFRALVKEASTRTHAVFDMGRALEGATQTDLRAERVRGDNGHVGEPLRFRGKNLRPCVWSAVESWLGDRVRYALHATLYIMYHWPGSWPGWVDFGDDRGRLVPHEKLYPLFDFAPVAGSGHAGHSFAYHGERLTLEPMRDYMRLAIDDQSALAGNEVPHEPSGGEKMHIDVGGDDATAGSDLKGLEEWAARETAAWASPGFGRMARARTIDYCAAKYLEPGTRARDVTNLHALVAERVDAREYRAIRNGDARALVEIDGELKGKYAVACGRAAAWIVAREHGVSVDGDVEFASVPLLTARLTRKNGAEERFGYVTLRQRHRALVFSCVGGVRGAVEWALQLAGVAREQWRYADRHEIRACGTTIAFGEKTTIDGHALDAAPSEYSSLWYTTSCAAVFPIRRDGALALAVFVGNGDEAGIAFGDAETIRPSAELGGTFFVAALDAAGVLPACAPREAHALLCAFGRASVCGVRLMPMVRQWASLLGSGGWSGGGCLYAAYAACALGGEACARPAPYCVARIRPPESAARPGRPGRPGRPETPMDGVAVELVEGVNRLRGRAPGRAGFDGELERRRAANRARWRFWLGTVEYGAAERDTAFLAAAIGAAKHLAEGNERLGVLMSDRCLAPYAASGARVPFEAAGKFMTCAQAELVEAMLAEKRSAVQLNMGFGKSALVVPMLVLRYLERYRVVVVTQPAHLVAPALRIIGAAVAARPFVEGVACVVTSRTENLHALHGRACRTVVVCSSVELQDAVLRSAGGGRVGMYRHQRHRAHIADEIDECADPLTCELSWPTGERRAHHTETDALTYHKVLCDVALGSGAAHSNEPYYAQLARVAESARKMRLNVQYGLVDTEGVYAAIPYKYADTPMHDSRYSNVDAAGTLAVLAALHTAALSPAAVAALERAMVEVVGKTARATLRAATEETRRLLFAVLVALPQVFYYPSQTVLSFLDALGVADAFAAFSGTMAFGLPLPALDASDPRHRYVPQAVGGLLAVAPDKTGIALVERHVRAARCEFVPGEPSAGRANQVVAWLEALGRDRQLVIVDACGEFGMVDSAFLRAARTFDELGELRAGGGVVYYAHKHSRGTDAALDVDAAGQVVVDENTTLTRASQAMYRLRGIDYGTQTVTFVVCGLSEMSGSALYDRLVANDTARSARSAQRARVQAERAEMPKHGEGDFAFANAPDDDVEGTQQQQQQQQQQQHLAHDPRDTSCIRASGVPEGLDPFVLYEPADYARRELGASSLLAALRDTSVHVSPLLMYTHRDPAHGVLEHAFAVLRGTPRTVALCAQVEVWAVKPDDAGRRREASFYTKSGALLRGAPADPGDVLFGRYLCDDALAHGEQAAFLAYMRSRYATKRARARIYEVLSCLRRARLIDDGRGGALGSLSSDPDWARVSDSEPAEVALVRSVLDGTWPAPHAAYGAHRRRRFIG